MRPRPDRAGAIRDRRRPPLQRRLRRPAAGQVLAGPERAQPQPLLLPPVRHRRQGALARPLPSRWSTPSTARSRRSTRSQPRDRRRPRPDRRAEVDDRADAVRPRTALHDRAARTRSRPRATARRRATSTSSRSSPTRPAARPTKGGTNDVQLGDLGEAADAAGGRRQGRPDQGRLQAHAALGHRVLLGLETARPRRPADGRSRPAGSPRLCTKRGAAGVSHFFWYSLRDDARHDRPAIQRDARVRPLLPRRQRSSRTSRRQVLDAFRFPFVAYPRKPRLEFWGRTPTSGAGKVRIEACRGGAGAG